MTVRGVVFDVDGTVLRGTDAIDGAREGLDYVARAGLQHLFVSNNPTKPPTAYEQRFATAGFEVDSTDVLTAGVVTAEYLTAHHETDRIAVVGEPGLVEMLREADLTVDRITEAADVDHRQQDVFVASMDREFDYEMLRASLGVLSGGVQTFLGTDPDVVIPTADGPAPGSGAIIDAIANVAGREPDAVLGKPGETIRKLVLDHLGLPPSDVLVVGDRLDTDIAFGQQAGMPTALVRTGVTDEADLQASPIDPDYVLDSLAALPSLLESGVGELRS